MRTWDQLTEAEKKNAIQYEAVQQLNAVAETDEAHVLTLYGESMLEAVERAAEDCARLSTPWFYHQYLWERGQELFEAEAALFLESCLFRREDDPLVVTLHGSVSCRETEAKKGPLPLTKKRSNLKSKNPRSTKR